MKIVSLTLSNFRGYKERTVIPFNDLTVFVGRNDIGKSTVLEALDIFLNNNAGVVKLDEKDANIFSGSDEVEISVEFEDLPIEIVIDSDVSTNLGAEYMLNKNKRLEVVKRYSKGSGSKPSVYIKAFHPTNPECANLLSTKIADLRKIVQKNGIECETLSVSSKIRSAIWEHFKDDLQLQEVEIEVNKEDMKKIWPKLEKLMPIYFLFQADRKNRDNDEEVQDPLKAAVKEIFQDPEIQEYCAKISEKVIKSLTVVSDKTLEKLNEIDPNVAEELRPVIPTQSELKWVDVFKNVSIEGENSIPINKRGSGIKRLVLLSFFRAKAETQLTVNAEEDTRVGSVIYAIEEPETSQHAQNQKLLINSLKTLARHDKTQVIVTTHSSKLTKELSFEDIVLISNNGNTREISRITPKTLPYPSLNEVNFSVYGDSFEEYHNELYGYIESNIWIKEFKSWMSAFETKQYIRVDYRKGKETVHDPVPICLSEYVRHRIHHPENTHNLKYEHEEILRSINKMREFIELKRQEELGA